MDLRHPKKGRIYGVIQGYVGQIPHSIFLLSKDASTTRPYEYARDNNIRNTEEAV